MSGKRISSRTKVIEACSSVALVVSQTQSGAAHTVQLMLRDPEFRARALREAFERNNANPQPGVHGDLTDAEHVLRGYMGRAI